MFRFQNFSVYAAAQKMGHIESQLFFIMSAHINRGFYFNFMKWKNVPNDFNDQVFGKSLMGH